MRHDSLANAQQWQADGQSFVRVPDGFFVAGLPGPPFAARLLPDGQVVVGIDDADLAEMLVDVLDDMERGRGGPDGRGSALVLKLAGDQRVAEAMEVRAAVAQLRPS